MVLIQMVWETKGDGTATPPIRTGEPGAACYSVAGLRSSVTAAPGFGHPNSSGSTMRWCSASGVGCCASPWASWPIEPLDDPADLADVLAPFVDLALELHDRDPRLPAVGCNLIDRPDQTSG